MAGGWEATGRRVVWRAPGCRAYIFLLQQPQVLLSLSDAAPSLWDYTGRSVIHFLSSDSDPSSETSRSWVEVDHMEFFSVMCQATVGYHECCTAHQVITTTRGCSVLETAHELDLFFFFFLSFQTVTVCYNGKASELTVQNYN